MWLDQDRYSQDVSRCSIMTPDHTREGLFQETVPYSINVSLDVSHYTCKQENNTITKNVTGAYNLNIYPDEEYHCLNSTSSCLLES